MISYNEWKQLHEIGAASAVSGINLGPEISWVGAPSGGSLKSAAGDVPVKRHRKKKKHRKHRKKKHCCGEIE